MGLHVPQTFHQVQMLQETFLFEDAIHLSPK